MYDKRIRAANLAKSPSFSIKVLEFNIIVFFKSNSEISEKTDLLKLSSISSELRHKFNPIEAKEILFFKKRFRLQVAERTLSEVSENNQDNQLKN